MRNDITIKTLIASIGKYKNISKIESIFYLYTNGIIETNDVLRLANIDYYQFRNYLNDNNIPYRYEDGFDDSIDQFDDLLDNYDT